MTEITKQIEALAKYSYESDREATDKTEWEDVSRNTRASYINEAKEQYEYIIDMLSVLGASPANVERLTENLAIHMEHSTKLMLENAELKAKISRRDASVRELKEKQKEYLKHMDSMIDSSKSSKALKESEKKIRSLQETQNTLIDEAKTSADMLEQLIPLQEENKKLIEERDRLDMALNLAIQNQQKKMQKNPSTASNEAGRAKVLAFLQLHGVKTGKKLISSALGESKVGQAKTSAENWITVYEKRHGMEALLKACDSI